MNLSFFNLQGNIVIGNDTGKFLSDVQHFYDVTHWRQASWRARHRRAAYNPKLQKSRPKAALIIE
jgi:hypothetical protein